MDGVAAGRAAHLCVPGLTAGQAPDVFAAPAIIAGVFLVTLLAALPLAVSLRGALQEPHLGTSLMAGRSGRRGQLRLVAGIRVAGHGARFDVHAVDHRLRHHARQRQRAARQRVLITPIAWAIGIYLVAWIFLSGGILDRYARGRRIGAHGFFAASGTFFFRFLRLGIAAGIVYWFLFVVRARVAVHEMVRERDARPVGRAHRLLLASPDVPDLRRAARAHDDPLRLREGARGGGRSSQHDLGAGRWPCVSSSGIRCASPASLGTNASSSCVVARRLALVAPGPEGRNFRCSTTDRRTTVLRDGATRRKAALLTA